MDAARDNRTVQLQQQMGMTRYKLYVAVHLRTGRIQHVNDFLRATNNETTWRQYYTCAKSLQQRLHAKCATVAAKTRHSTTAPIPPIYLASDTVDAKQQFLNWDSSIKTLTDMEVFHIDKTRKNDLADSSLAELDIFADVQLLVNATCLVGTKTSSFSNLGKLLSPQHPHRCFAYYNDCGPDVVQAAVDGLPDSVCDPIS